MPTDTGKATLWAKEAKNAAEEVQHIAIGVLNALELSWISEGGDDTEALTVEIWLGGFPVRLVCGYGRQEYDQKEQKEGFGEYLNKETQNTTAEGASFILQMDGNLWAGSNIIKHDENKQNKNGKLFELYLKNNPKLSVVNALPVCKGLFTRENTTKLELVKVF